MTARFAASEVLNLFFALTNRINRLHKKITSCQELHIFHEIGMQGNSPAGVIIHILDRIGSGFLKVFRHACLQTVSGGEANRSVAAPPWLDCEGYRRWKEDKKTQAVAQIQIGPSHALFINLNCVLDKGDHLSYDRKNCWHCCFPLSRILRKKCVGNIFRPGRGLLLRMTAC